MLEKDVFLKSFVKSLEPPEEITVTEWSRTKRYLSASTSSEPGLYRPERTAYWIDVLNDLTSNNGIEEVVLMKASQVGGSEVGINFLGYSIDISPGPMMVVLPSVDMAEKYTRSRVDKMIEACPSLQKKVAKKNDKLRQNTSLFKDIDNGLYIATGANSASQLRMMPISKLLLEEVDAYPLDVEGEGSPVKLAVTRTTTFARRKIAYISSPTIEGISVIHKKFMEGDQRYYNVPCPHCGQKQKLLFSQLRYEKESAEAKCCIPSSVYYECFACGGEIKENLKNWLFDVSRAEWIPENPLAPKKIRSYQLNILYSPWKSWVEVIDDYLKACNDTMLMKTFINTALGETYKEKSHQPNHLALYNRKTEFLPFQVPKDFVYCVAGADTQDNRVAIIVLAFGCDMECFVADYVEIFGDTSDPDFWETEVRRYIDTPLRHETGLELHIDKFIVDSQGHRSSIVYDFAQKNQDKVMAIKGVGHDTGYYFKQSKVIDIDQNGRPYDNPIHLYLVNTILTKKTVYSMLGTKEPGPKYVHFNKDLDQSFFKMLTAEQYITRVIKGVLKEEFILPSGVRNEALDCFCYALAYARSKGVHKLYGSEYERVYKELIVEKIKELDEKKKLEERKKLEEDKKTKSLDVMRRNDRSNNNYFSNNLSFDRRF